MKHITEISNRHISYAPRRGTIFGAMIAWFFAGERRFLETQDKIETQSLWH